MRILILLIFSIIFCMSLSSCGSIPTPTPTPTPTFTTSPTPSPSPTSSLPNGLLVYFPFNGNANDESGNGHNGTVNNATLCNDRNGQTNKAYYFDGVNDWISTSFNNVISNENFSISFWIKLPSNNYNGSANFFIFSGKFACCTYQEAKIGVTVYDDPYAWIVATRDIWVHFVGTYDGSFFRVYKNGILNYTVNNPGPNSTSYEPYNLSIGHSTRLGYDGVYFNGSLDSIRIYNRVLSESEITELYGLND